jgi:hypothetical protein
MDESLCNSDKYAVFVCFEGSFLGEKDQYNNWLDPFCAWIKALYLVKILLMTVCLCPNSYVFLILNTILICAKYISFPSATV